MLLLYVYGSLSYVSCSLLFASLLFVVLHMNCGCLFYIICCLHVMLLVRCFMFCISLLFAGAELLPGGLYMLLYVMVIVGGVMVLFVL